MLAKYKKVLAKPFRKYRKSTAVLQLLMEGVPISIRGQLWAHIVDAKGGKEAAGPGYYASLVSKPCFFRDAIERDVSALMESHPLGPALGNHGQASMVDVLCALAVHDPELAYARPLASLALVLLSQIGDDEVAFFTFLAFLKWRFRDMLVGSQNKLKQVLHAFHELTNSCLPTAARALVAASVSETEYAVPWATTLFADVLPPPVLLRVWDLFFVRGFRTFYLASIALLGLYQDDLAAAVATSPSSLRSVINSLGVGLDPDVFISMMMSLSIDVEDIRDLERQHSILEKLAGTSQATL